jgi:hypothetical protein
MGYSCLRWIACFVLYQNIHIFLYNNTIRNNINSWSLALSKMTQGRPENVDFFIQNRDLLEL